MITIQTKVNQIPAKVLNEGAESTVAQSKLGQIWTADWHIRLILAGKAFRLSIGTIAAEADITMVGNGTAIELERPEALIAVDTGFLIPMSLNLAVNANLDTAADEVDVLMTSDRATAVSAAEINTAAGTAETPDNCLDGAEAFDGRCESIFTGDITDPVHSDVLYYKHHMRLTSTPLEVQPLPVDHVWEHPTFLAGPCTILLYVGATQAPTFVGSFVFAYVPASWVPVS